MIALAALLLGCLADAYSTNALIARGGYEKNLAWLVGKHPRPATVWLVIGVLPVIAGGLVLSGFPTWWPAIVALAAWRGDQALRNNRLQR